MAPMKNLRAKIGRSSAKTTPSSLRFAAQDSGISTDALMESLWQWSSCSECQSGSKCVKYTCPWRRKDRLNHYFEYCRKVVLWYTLHAMDRNHGTRIDPGDLLCAIKTLRSPLRPMNQSRCTLFKRAFEARSEALDEEIQSQIFDLAIKISCMVHCELQNPIEGFLEQGFRCPGWEQDEGLGDYIDLILPTVDRKFEYFGAAMNESSAVRESRHKLKADNLKTALGVDFYPTDDLTTHLKLELHRGRRVVKIFHHIAFLKEHLRSTKKPWPGTGRPHFGWYNAET